MLTRRDKKIAAQAAQLLEARKVAADAIALARRLRGDNAALQKNLEVLQRPRHAAKRNEIARTAVDVLNLIEPLAEDIFYKLHFYARQKERLSEKD
jgi:hypothetical protein